MKGTFRVKVPQAAASKSGGRVCAALSQLICNQIEAKACAKSHRSLTELRASLEAAWDEIDNDLLAFLLKIS